MKPVKVNLTAVTAVLFLLLPNFFRVGPVSFYYLVILAVCGFAVLRGRISLPEYALTNVGWNIRAGLLLIPMLYHNEYTAIILYMIAPILLFLLLMCDIRSENRLNAMLDLLVWCGAVNVVVSLIEVLTGFNLSIALCNDGTVVYNPMYRYGILRVYGCFANPINNGLFSMMMSAVILYRIYSGSMSNSKRRVFWGIWAVDLLVIVLTSSRAAMLSAAVLNVLILWMAGAFRLKANTLIVFLFGLVAVVLLMVIPNPLTEQIEEMLISVLQVVDDLLGTDFVGDAASKEIVEGVGNRLELFDWVVDAVGDNYRLGMGRASKFSYVINEFGHTKESIENQYLFEFYKYGIVGLCGKVFLFTALLISRFRGMLKERKAGVKLGLNGVLFMVYLAYFLSLFTVAQNEEKKLFYLLVVLGEIYSRNRFYLQSKGVRV